MLVVQSWFLNSLISLDISSLLQVLGTRRLMHINHEDFEKVFIHVTIFFFFCAVCMFINVNKCNLRRYVSNFRWCLS